MKPFKHTDHKAADKNHVPPRNPGHDFHSAKDKELRTVKETSHHHKDNKRDK